MPDPIDPKIADEPQDDVVAPAESGEVVKKMTHEVDADDMFSSTT